MVVSKNCGRGAPIPTSSRDLVVKTVSSCLGRYESVGMFDSCSGSKDWLKRGVLMDYWREWVVCWIGSQV